MPPFTWKGQDVLISHCWFTGCLIVALATNNQSTSNSMDICRWSSCPELSLGGEKGNPTDLQTQWKISEKRKKTSLLGAVNHNSKILVMPLEQMYWKLSGFQLCVSMYWDIEKTAVSRHTIVQRGKGFLPARSSVFSEFRSWGGVVQKVAGVPCTSLAFKLLAAVRNWKNTWILSIWFFFFGLCFHKMKAKNILNEKIAQKVFQFTVLKCSIAVSRILFFWYEQFSKYNN